MNIRIFFAVNAISTVSLTRMIEAHWQMVVAVLLPVELIASWCYFPLSSLQLVSYLSLS